MAVTNPYYEFTPEFIPGTKARSEEVNIQFQAIQNAFDFLPGSSDAITTGTATFAPESGSGNAYVVTMPDTRTTEQDGDEVIFFATHTNTGAATLEVDGLGAKSIVRADGNALTANDIQSGLLYVMRYDASNTRYQLVGPSTSYLTDAAASAAAAAASAAAALVSEGLANEWAVNPVNTAISTNPGEYSSLHWAAGAKAWATDPRDSAVAANFGGGAGQYSALHWADGASEWAIRAEDSPIPTTVGGDGATTYSAFHWAQKALASASFNRINTDISTATPPTSEAVTGAYDIYDADDTDLLADLGYIASNTLRIKNYMHGGPIQLRGEDTGGTPQTIFQGDPDSWAAMYFNGTVKIRTDTDGLWVYSNQAVATPPIAHTGTARLRIVDADGTDTLADLSFIAGDTLTLYNRIHGSAINMIAENAAGSQAVLFIGSPDGSAALYYAGSDRIATGPTGLAAIRSDASPGLGAAQSSQLMFEQNDGTDLGYVGFQNQTDLSIRNLNHGGPISMAAENNAGTLRTILIADPDSSIDIYSPQDGVVRASTNTTGRFLVHSDGNTDSEGRNLNLAHQDGTVRGQFGYIDANGELIIRNLVTDDDFLVRVTSTAGGTEAYIRADAGLRGVSLYSENAIKARTYADGFEIRGDATAATPPTTYTGLAELRWTDSDGTDVLMEMEINNTGAYAWIGRVHGSPFFIQGENASGTIQTGFRFDPDSDVQLYYTNTKVFATDGLGEASIYGDTTSTSDTVRLRLKDSAGTEKGFIGFNADSTLRIENQLAGSVALYSNNAGTNLKIISGGASATTVKGEILLDLQVGTDAATETALRCTANSSVALYYNNVQKFLTDTNGVDVIGSLYLQEKTAASADTAAYGQLWVQTDTPNRFMFTDDTGQDYHVAMVGGFENDNVFSNGSRNFNTTGNFAANNILYFGNGSNYTVTLGNSTGTGLTNWPIHTSIQIIAPGSGVITITEGTSTTLYFDDGSDTVGGCTISGGVATIYRWDATTYIIWGSGLT